MASKTPFINSIVHHHMKGHYLIKIALFILLAVAFLLSHLYWDIASYFKPEQIQKWLSYTGGFAPLVYMIFMALAVVISPIPSLPLDMAAGVFFGPIPGTVYSVTGALAGAVISFMIGRSLGRELIERFLGGHINFCVSCSDRFLTRIVFFSRLLPIVSFDVISYGAGLTKISLKKFAIATFFGMIPLTFIYNYFGSVLVFGKGLTFIFGIIMIILFLVAPAWLERKGIVHTMAHNNRRKTKRQGRY